MAFPPIQNDGADVVPFPKRKVEPPSGDVMLIPPPSGKCIHFNTSFEVDEDAGDCKCLGCGERVTAIFVLTQLMKMESRWNRTREAYQDEMKRLEERSSNKCNHCGKMTRISTR